MHIWIKLQWEANRLKAAQEAQPFDLISTIYGALNSAITAQSLEDWTIRALTQRDRRSGLNAGAYRKAIAAAVPMQPMFRDIANTAKHGEYRDENWLGGTVELIHTPGFAGTTQEYVLIYHGEDGTARTSLEVFDHATLQWRFYLTRANVPGFEGLPLDRAASEAGASARTVSGKKDAFRAEHDGPLFCEDCGLEPSSEYGDDLADACFEAHHTRTAVADMEDDHRRPGRRTSDAPCVNRHRLEHARLRGASGVQAAQVASGGPNA